MSRPTDVRYLKTHEWARLTADGVEVGISDHAVEMLNHEIVYLELPKVGKKVRQGDSFGVVESVKAASDLYAPVSGEIVAINSDLAKDPGTLSDGPFTTGWMIRIRPDSPREFEGLLDPAQYDEFAAAENH
jgi:glycine cleavage system H protein